MVKKERLTLTPHRLPSGLLLKDFTQSRVLTTIVKFKKKKKRLYTELLHVQMEKANQQVVFNECSHCVDLVLKC